MVRHREEVQGQEEEVKKVAGELETLQGTLSQLRRQITEAEERLPQLEETKKASVAGISLSFVPFSQPPFSLRFLLSFTPIVYYYVCDVR